MKTTHYLVGPNQVETWDAPDNPDGHVIWSVIWGIPHPLAEFLGVGFMGYYVSRSARYTDMVMYCHTSIFGSHNQTIGLKQFRQMCHDGQFAEPFIEKVTELMGWK